MNVIWKTISIYSLAGVGGVGRGEVGILARKGRWWKSLFARLKGLYSMGEPGEPSINKVRTHLSWTLYLLSSSIRLGSFQVEK